MIDTAPTHPLALSQPMARGRRDVRRPSNNKISGNRGKPGGEMNPRLRRCVSYPRYAEATNLRPGQLRQAAADEIWYCWTCAPRMEFRVWLDLHEQGFTTVLPLVLDKSDRRNIAVPAFPRYGLVTLEPAPDRRFVAYPTQMGHSPSWRLITDLSGAVARPIPVAPDFVDVWASLGRDGDGIVEFVRTKDGAKFLKGSADLGGWKRGEVLRVMSSAYAGNEAVVERDLGDDIEVQVAMFGRVIKATLPKTAVERTT